VLAKLSLTKTHHLLRKREQYSTKAEDAYYSLLGSEVRAECCQYVEWEKPDSSTLVAQEFHACENDPHESKNIAAGNSKKEKGWGLTEEALFEGEGFFD
jgi:hypothetical protein